MSLKYSSFLNSDVDWTNDEIESGKKYLKWEELTINWENIDLLWEEIFILLEVSEIIKKRGGSSPGYQEYVDGNPWKKLNEDIGEEKTKKVIKIYCRVNNIEYDESREVMNEVKVSVNDFERFVQDAISVKILS
jgi:hypothetical protein